jgi:hypothetical protein
MRPTVLREILNHALRVAVASPLVMGCSSGTGPGGTGGGSGGGAGGGSGCAVNTVTPDLTGYSAPLCPTSEASLAALAPSVIPDAIQLRKICPQWFGCGGAGGSDVLDADGGLATNVVATFGTPCASAINRPSCDSSFAGARPNRGFGRTFGVCDTYYLVTTRGDEVKEWASIDELKVLLGTIDSEQEAAFLAFAHTYELACPAPLDRGGVKRSADGSYTVVATKRKDAPGAIENRVYLRIDPSGELTETANDTLQCVTFSCGRRPAGLVATPRTSFGSPLGRFLADSARLEAASVPAFLALRDELQAHGAPAELRGSAVLAALEEISHARLTARLARQYGSFVRDPVVTPRAVRSLREVAIENATEGCVRETYGAMVAQRQAASAQNPFVRAAFERIAVDEARHSALSWEVDAWAQRRLGRHDRAQLSTARREAVATLERQLQTESSAALQRDAGLPPADEAVETARRLFDALES